MAYRLPQRRRPRMPAPRPETPLGATGLQQSRQGRGGLQSSVIYVDESQCVEPARRLGRSLFLEGYEIVGTLGSGSSGVIYRVRCRRSGRIYAIKKTTITSSAASTSSLQEAQLLAEVGDCPTCLPCYRCWAESDATYMVTDAADANLDSLACHYHALREAFLWAVLADVSLALEHTHAHAIANCDVKPENILVSYYGPKRGEAAGAAATGASAAASLLDTRRPRSSRVLEGGVFVSRSASSSAASSASSSPASASSLLVSDLRATRRPSVVQADPPIGNLRASVPGFVSARRDDGAACARSLGVRLYSTSPFWAARTGGRLLGEDAGGNASGSGNGGNAGGNSGGRGICRWVRVEDEPATDEWTRLVSVDAAVAKATAAAKAAALTRSTFLSRPTSPRESGSRSRSRSRSCSCSRSHSVQLNPMTPRSYHNGSLSRDTNSPSALDGLEAPLQTPQSGRILQSWPAAPFRSMGISDGDVAVLLSQYGYYRYMKDVAPGNPSRPDAPLRLWPADVLAFTPDRDRDEALATPVMATGAFQLELATPHSARRWAVAATRSAYARAAAAAAGRKEPGDAELAGAGGVADAVDATDAAEFEERLCEACESCDVCDDGGPLLQHFAFTLADFGHAQRGPFKDSDTGDSRYICPHFFQTGVPSCAADVYSFGLSVLEVMTDTELPKQDPEFGFIRASKANILQMLDPQIFGRCLQQYVFGHAPHPFPREQREKEREEKEPPDEPSTPLLELASPLFSQIVYSRELWAAVLELIEPDPALRPTIKDWRQRWRPCLERVDRRPLYAQILRRRQARLSAPKGPFNSGAFNSGAFNGSRCNRLLVRRPRRMTTERRRKRPIGSLRDFIALAGVHLRRSRVVERLERLGLGTGSDPSSFSSPLQPCLFPPALWAHDRLSDSNPIYLSGDVDESGENGENGCTTPTANAFARGAPDDCLRLSASLDGASSAVRASCSPSASAFAFASNRPQTPLDASALSSAARDRSYAKEVSFQIRPDPVEGDEEAGREGGTEGTEGVKCGLGVLECGDEAVIVFPDSPEDFDAHAKDDDDGVGDNDTEEALGEEERARSGSFQSAQSVHSVSLMDGDARGGHYSDDNNTVINFHGSPHVASSSGDWERAAAPQRVLFREESAESIAPVGRRAASGPLLPSDHSCVEPGSAQVCSACHCEVPMPLDFVVDVGGHLRLSSSTGELQELPGLAGLADAVEAACSPSSIRPGPFALSGISASYRSQPTAWAILYSRVQSLVLTYTERLAISAMSTLSIQSGLYNSIQVPGEARSTLYEQTPTAFTRHIFQGLKSLSRELKSRRERREALSISSLEPVGTDGEHESGPGFEESPYGFRTDTHSVVARPHLKSGSMRHLTYEELQRLGYVTPIQSRCQHGSGWSVTDIAEGAHERRLRVGRYALTASGIFSLFSLGNGLLCGLLRLAGVSPSLLRLLSLFVAIVMARALRLLNLCEPFETCEVAYVYVERLNLYIHSLQFRLFLVHYFVPLATFLTTAAWLAGTTAKRLVVLVLLLECLIVASLSSRLLQ
ncbi:Kinase, WEE [Giardia muris]|uniref:non-specific serine/threonine protein kinase n=1 Tax=Giardia muris TaxID=5742 RepID=A0A4Z1SM01_GIAMU|nr:Kinase, WEE [Giardia muris]|eukprot:TNJ26570.1 Kinase, WEE [Giardia muris]